VGLGGEYFQRSQSGNQFSLSGDASRSNFDNSQGLDGTSNESIASGLFDLRRIRLNSSVSTSDFEQTNGVGAGYESDRTSWYHLLTAYLPFHLRSDVSYRRQDNQSTIRIPGAPNPRELMDLSEQFGLDLVHRLYESLDTTYSYLHDDRSSSGGDSTTTTNALALAYTKTIPRGRILLGANGGRTETDTAGSHGRRTSRTRRFRCRGSSCSASRTRTRRPSACRALASGSVRVVLLGRGRPLRDRPHLEHARDPGPRAAAPVRRAGHLRFLRLVQPAHGRFVLGRTPAPTPRAWSSSTPC
jgi:hypothetical protein